MTSPTVIINGGNVQVGDNNSQTLETQPRPQLPSRRELCREIHALLSANYADWKGLGPLGELAQSNPGTNLVSAWHVARREGIVPRNRRIRQLLEEHGARVFSPTEQAACAAFHTHAIAFETHVQERLDNYPRFPSTFSEMIDNAITE